MSSIRERLEQIVKMQQTRELEEEQRQLQILEESNAKKEKQWLIIDALVPEQSQVLKELETQSHLVEVLNDAARATQGRWISRNWPNGYMTPQEREQHRAQWQPGSGKRFYSPPYPPNPDEFEVRWLYELEFNIKSLPPGSYDPSLEGQFKIPIILLPNQTIEIRFDACYEEPQAAHNNSRAYSDVPIWDAPDGNKMILSVQQGNVTKDELENTITQAISNPYRRVYLEPNTYGYSRYGEPGTLR